MARLAAAAAIAGTPPPPTRLPPIVAHAAVPRTAAAAPAVAMTASTPARALGLPDVGELAVSRPADLVGLAPDLAIEAVYRWGPGVPVGR